MIIISEKKKSLARRYYANLFDYAILLFLLTVYIFVMGEANDSGGYKVTGLKALVIPFIWFLYFPVCESIFGQTIGKKAFHLYIVDLNGDSPSIVQTFLRRMLDLFEIMFLGVPALLLINHSEKNQRLGDMMAGTAVIRTDAVCRFCWTDLELSPKEVVRDLFKCPVCYEVN